MLGGEGVVLWRRLERVEEDLEIIATACARLTARLDSIEAQIRARLKEEAESRESRLAWMERKAILPDTDDSQL